MSGKGVNQELRFHFPMTVAKVAVSRRHPRTELRNELRRVGGLMRLFPNESGLPAKDPGSPCSNSVRTGVADDWKSKPG
jgi:hypothetical protein